MKTRDIAALERMLQSCIQVLDLAHVIQLETDNANQSIKLHRVQLGHTADFFIKIVPYTPNDQEWVTSGTVSSDELQIASVAIANFVAAQVREELFNWFQELKDE